MTKKVWVEEFGGGAWVEYPVRPNADEVAREALRKAVYGPAYQGPEPTRSTLGIWK